MPPFDAVRRWMFEEALPFWGEAGVDRARGGYFEELDFQGRPTAVAFKRTRVVCRQIYVFSHAAILGWEHGADLAAWGYEYLTKKAALPNGAYVRTLTADGAVLDATPDLYDFAFVLLALSWRYRASGDDDCRLRARSLLDFIEREMRAPEGFWHWLPPTGAREQNPHMHLLESCLFAHEAFAEERFLTLADELVSLFLKRFFNGETLGEFFDDALAPAAGVAGQQVWPGHHFEWAWILGQYGKVRGRDMRRTAQALVSFAEAHGLNPETRMVMHAVDRAGAPVETFSRAWENAERIKGHAALFEMGGHDPVPAVTEATQVLMDRYLAVAPAGAWVDVFDGAGRPIAAAIPTSTLYHVFLAFAELIRLENKLAGA